MENMDRGRGLGYRLGPKPGSAALDQRLWFLRLAARVGFGVRALIANHIVLKFWYETLVLFSPPSSTMNAHHYKAAHWVGQGVFDGLTSFTEFESRVNDIFEEKDRGDVFHDPNSGFPKLLLGVPTNGGSLW